MLSGPGHWPPLPFRRSSGEIFVSFYSFGSIGEQRNPTKYTWCAVIMIWFPVRRGTKNPDFTAP